MDSSGVESIIRTDRLTTSTSLQRRTNSLHSGCPTADNTMRFENPTKWELFLDGFRNILYILDCYNDGDEWGYGEFWESLSIGWFQEYIYPYDDPYRLSISPERRLRLAQEPERIILSAEAYDELVERLNQPQNPAVVERIKELLQKVSPWEREE